MNKTEIKNKKQLLKLYTSHTFSIRISKEYIDDAIIEYKDLIYDDTVYIMDSITINKLLKLYRNKNLLYKENEVLFMFINDTELANNHGCRWLDDIINNYEVDTDYYLFDNLYDKFHRIKREIKWFFYNMFHKEK